MKPTKADVAAALNTAADVISEYLENEKVLQTADGFLRLV